MHRRILLTGPPGCGKTTVVGNVADILRDGASGFYTEEIRDAKKRRIGFRVVTLAGSEEIRRQRDVKTIIVTLENRGALPAQLAAMLLGATD